MAKKHTKHHVNYQVYTTAEISRGYQDISAYNSNLIYDPTVGPSSLYLVDLGLARYCPKALFVATTTEESFFKPSGLQTIPFGNFGTVPQGRPLEPNAVCIQVSGGNDEVYWLDYGAVRGFPSGQCLDHFQFNRDQIRPVDAIVFSHYPPGPVVQDGTIHPGS